MTGTRQASAAEPAVPAAADRRRDRRGGRRRLGALAGLVAAAVGLAAGELVAAFVSPQSSPVVAVGSAAIPLTPEPVKQFAIQLFGTHDKTALLVGIVVVLALYAVLVGLLALRSRRLGAAGILLFGLIGIAAAVTRPSAGTADGVPSFIGALAGIAVLLALVRLLSPPEDVDADGDRTGTGMDRRQFFVTSGLAVGLAALAAGGGRLLQRRFAVAAARERLVLPRPASPAKVLPAGADLSPTVPGLTPLVTRNADFYRIDTALTVPQIDPSGYSLRLTGMFDSPRSFTLAQLFDRPDVVERDVTLTCVSNEVGGTLAGNARWLGVPLAPLLREAGIRPASSQLVCRSVDGMTIGAPTRSALDVEGAMLAFGMNGEPLPVEHGFPVRMLIPGLYGYVSACKWLAGIEASTFDAFDAYWVQRGWTKQGPIKVESRIDTPAAGSSFRAGRRAVAGVAWAQDRGIGRVEVRVDAADWREARLSPLVGRDVWRQWVLPVDFAPGRHTVSVRATTADGEVQTAARADPYPSGATGWHTVHVTAT
jgi:DMSO/TMAO reductase YedYZ molybdopterin-dependent catalytic subunit